jgi:DNA-binding response OmpR family regulator
MTGRILAVDDDRAILRSLTRLLGGEGYFVQGVATAEEADRYLKREEFDLVLLDIGLPGLDGFSYCRQVRAHWSGPLIILSARSDSADRVIGLELGADDYVVKPFEPRELLARVRAHLRRTREYGAGTTAPAPVMAGELEIDLSKRIVRRRGQQVELTTREFDLLELLARHPDKALNRDWIFEEVWGYDADLGIKALAVYMRRLRLKLEDEPENPRILTTVRGFGYRLVTQPEEMAASA